MAAVIERQRTGRGQVVEVSMQEAVANLIRQRYVVHYRDGKPTPRRGNGAPPGAVPDGLYACAPGGPNDYVYIYVQPMNQGMWQDFARAIGREDLLADPRCVDAPSRWAHREALNGIARAWTGARSKQEVLTTLGKAGVPCGAILDTQEVLDDPHMNARGVIETIEHPTRGRFRVPGCPIRLSDSDAAPAGRPAHRRSARRGAGPHAGGGGRATRTRRDLTRVLRSLTRPLAAVPAPRARRPRAGRRPSEGGGAGAARALARAGP
jgi:formyl-CoA transferase